jgi:SAM-dependent methyltransferase
MDARSPVGTLHGRLVHARRVRALAGHFSDLLPTSHRVLDVGCGDGLIDRLVLERRPDLTIRGIDPLVRADAHIPVAAFDGKTLPFADNSWDTVMFCDVLHHTLEPITLLREAVRVARISLVIKDHNADGLLARSTLRLMDVVGNAPHGVALPCNYLTAAEWRRAFADLGLRPVETRERLALYPWWADPVFGRSLHFIARLDVRSATA